MALISKKQGKSFITPFLLRIIGAIIGSIGFLMLAYNVPPHPVIGTTFIGIGSIIIAAGES